MLSAVAEHLVPRLLALLPAGVETTRDIAIDILRDVCLGYQHSPKLLVDYSTNFMTTLGELKAAAAFGGTALGLAQIVQCLLYVHDRLPSEPAYKSLVRLKT